MSMAQLFLTGRTLHHHPGSVVSLLYRSSTILTPVRRASTASRKQVTVVNDDGRVRWGDLTATEKIARTTQKTFHFGIVVTGMVMTVGSTRRNRGFKTLTPLRLEPDTFCTKRSLHQTARQDISTRLWMRFVPIQGFKNYLGLAIRSELLESQHRTNGLGQDLLRKAAHMRLRHHAESNLPDQQCGRIVMAGTTS